MSGRVIAGLVLIGVVLSGIAGADAAPPPPVAALAGGTEIEPGALLTVTGEGWPAHSNVIVEVCGNLGSSSLDCDRTRSRTVGVGPSGLLSVAITAEIPPSPCPCVVRVSSLKTQDRFAIPVTLIGAPNAPVTEVIPDPDARALRIDQLQVVAESRYREWLGMAARREVSFRITNAGQEMLTGVPVEVIVARGDDAGRATDIEPIGRIAPGESVTIRAKLDLDPLSTGRWLIRGTVGRGTWQSKFEADSTSFPWGLLVVGLVLLQVMLISGRNRLRRRFHPVVVAPTLVPATAPVPVAEPGVDLIIDLREARPAPLVPPRPFPVEVPSLPTLEPDRTLTVVLAALDRVRAVSSIPDDTVAVVVARTTQDEGGLAGLAVRVAHLVSGTSTSEWYAPSEVEGVFLDSSSGSLASSIISAVTGDRPVTSGAESEVERHLTLLAGLVGAELLAPSVLTASADVTVAVALTVCRDDDTHISLVEISTGVRGVSPVVLSAVHTV